MKEMSQDISVLSPTQSASIPLGHTNVRHCTLFDLRIIKIIMPLYLLYSYTRIFNFKVHAKQDLRQIPYKGDSYAKLLICAQTIM